MREYVGKQLLFLSARAALLGHTNKKVWVLAELTPTPRPGGDIHIPRKFRVWHNGEVFTAFSYELAELDDA